MKYPGLGSLHFRKEGARQVHKNPDKASACSGRGGPRGLRPSVKPNVITHHIPRAVFPPCSQPHRAHALVAWPEEEGEWRPPASSDLREESPLPEGAVSWGQMVAARPC